jgi:hypothetical protein
VVVERIPIFSYCAGRASAREASTNATAVTVHLFVGAIRLVNAADILALGGQMRKTLHILFQGGA